MEWWYLSEDKKLMDDPGLSAVVDMLPAYLEKYWNT